MNRNTPEQQKQKSGYKVRRSNMTRREAQKKVLRPDGRSTPPAKKRLAERNPLPKEEVKRPAATREAPVAKQEASHPASVNIGAVPPAKKHRAPKNDFIKPTDIVRVKGGYDTLFLVLVIILTLFGIIMDFSASYAYAFNRYGDSFYFVKRQIIFAGIGLVAMVAAMYFDYRWIRKLTIPIFLGITALLVIVLVYGIASGVAQRWIRLGPITIQPSEFMKFALVFMLALYIDRNQDRITNYRNFWQSSTFGMFIPVTIVGVCCVLVALERHFSGTIILFLIGMVVIFAGGARNFWFFTIGGAALAVIAGAIMLFPYARERILMLWHPENYNPTGKIWQTLQGLYAVGSGGIFGVGLGNSRQKHLFVSQPQNDFIFSIIAEELGFAGAALVIILFMLLIWRGFVIALKAPDTFSSLVVIGLVSKVALQAALNIAVVTNVIPNTGISLPFFSYGGTALITQLGEMGVVLSISRFSYQRDL